uniref:Activin types I and II receptor domain-containing protein n=1 Tax=Strongyloides stercoralis TaxID=6248 RepID=A0AAF5CWL1_STRER
MKFSQIFILSIFLFYSKYSYSLKCYQGVYSKVSETQGGDYESSECEAEFCRTITGIHKNQERAHAGVCDTGRKCTEPGKVDIIMTVVDWYNQFSTSTEHLSEEAKKEYINVIDECCNTDNCNSLNNGAYTNVPVGRSLQIPTTSPGQTTNTINNNDNKPASSNSSGSLFSFYSYITLLSTFFIAGKYSYSLKCYNGGNSADEMFNGLGLGYLSQECSSNLCLSATIMDPKIGSTTFHTCEVYGYCDKAGIFDVVENIGDIVNKINPSYSKVIPEAMNQRVKIRKFCCDTDNCNSKENDSYKNLKTGAINKGKSKSEHEEGDNKSKETERDNESKETKRDNESKETDRDNASKKSESFVNLCSFISLFCAMFIIGLYKI